MYVPAAGRLVFTFVLALAMAPAAASAPAAQSVEALLGRDPATLASSASVELHLGRERIRARRVRVDVGALGAVTWTGRVHEPQTGSATIVLRPAEGGGAPTVQGVVRVGSRVLRIVPSQDGVEVVEVLADDLPPCGLGQASIVGEPGAGGGAPGPLSGGMRTVVDVVVLYTPAAKTGEGGATAVEALVDLAAAEANLAYANGGLDLVVRVVHQAETVYVESGNHFTDLQRLRNPIDGFMDEAHALRDQYGADCVALVTDGLNTCGNAYLWSDPPNPLFAQFAFSVVSRHCAVSNLSFAHELGHNMGCDHELASTSAGGGAYPWSHGYNTPSGLWRTVMGLQPGTRIPWFSDPGVTYQGEALGVPIGQPGAAHNVDSLKLVTPLVAAFRDPVPQPFGAGMPTSTGATATLAAGGSNDVSNADFQLQASGAVPGSTGIAFFGFGPAALPLAGGTLWVTPPLKRLLPQPLDAQGGASWSGVTIPGFLAGQEVFFQVWTADPANPAGAGVALTNALRVEFYD